ncbi:hypothetical protein Lal_00015665 [Lupinus albus]|nr:hypothetical protein Lal_00015665 [Lupinus albus]
MAERQPKRVKTIANRLHRTFEEGGPSSATPSTTARKRDPFFAPTLQASILARFHGRKLAYVRYADVPWLVEQGSFIELHGKFYPSLIREFYSNFVYKNGRYITMVKGKLIVLNAELFLAVGGLSSSGEPLGNCKNVQWEVFEALATYRSCLRDTVSVTPGGLTKVGALTVENRLLHYEQPTSPPEAPEASQAPPFGLAHLDALEQYLNQRVDVGLQALNDNLNSGLMNLYDRVVADIQTENDQTRGEIDRIVFILQTMSSVSNPSPSNKPS